MFSQIERLTTFKGVMLEYVNIVNKSTTLVHYSMYQEEEEETLYARWRLKEVELMFYSLVQKLKC